MTDPEREEPLPDVAAHEAAGQDAPRPEAVGPDVPGLDMAGLDRWLRETHPELVAGDRLEASLVAGGRSNLTYLVDGAAIPLVLRRPPLGHVLSGAHDMFREHRVIAALAGSAVPVPRAVDVVDDTAAAGITGTPFFVMERVEGRVLRDRAANADYSRTELRRLGLQVAEVLADLHAIDPVSVGLADFGRGDGYLARQLATWRRQLDASRSREVPRLDALQERLARGVPASARATIVHGDYRLDNAIVTDTPDGPRIAAILDWEMATLGDPLVDLGMLGMYWTITDLPGGDGVAPSSVDLAAGYPTFDELVDAYAARAGIAVPDLAWYRAFAAYKLAVILEGIHFRFRAGETVGDGFDRIGALVEPLAAAGLDHAAAADAASAAGSTGAASTGAERASALSSAPAAPAAPTAPTTMPAPATASAPTAPAPTGGIR